MTFDGAALVNTSVGVVFKVVVDGVGGGVLVINVIVCMVPGIKVVVIDVINGCALVVVKVFDVKPRVFVVVDVTNVFNLGFVLLSDVANGVVDDNVHGMVLFVAAAGVVVEVINNDFSIVVAGVKDNVAVDEGVVRFVLNIAVIVLIVVSVICMGVDEAALVVVMVNGELAVDDASDGVLALSVGVSVVAGVEDESGVCIGLDVALVIGMVVSVVVDDIDVVVLAIVVANVVGEVDAFILVVTVVSGMIVGMSGCGVVSIVISSVDTFVGLLEGILKQYNGF